MKRIYTKTGDHGTTGIHGGQRVEKDDIRIEANGCMDELNATIGIIRSLLPTAHQWQDMLHHIQHELMIVMSHVATPSAIREKNPNKLSETLTAYCEQQMDRMMMQLEKKGGFVLPGGTPVSAQCQFARTVARRAERRLWTLNRKDPVAREILTFVNRLSDLLFVMARFDMQQQNQPEEHWRRRRQGAAPEFPCGRQGLNPVMFAGTGSDVGKSIIAAAFCRIFKQDGYAPAPFKAQNMALNSYVTPQGLEIGRAQAVQAEAAGVPCHTDMNPLLLKPSSDHTSQVVLNGKPIGHRDAYDYFRKEGREELRQAVCDAFDRLSKRYSPIVMEGAGSISEINLRQSDLVNLPMAIHAGADVILVADIDRGGVFASVYGSIMLQNEEERRRIKGILINKFRGDIRLFESGINMLEELCGIPVVGVVPYYKDIHIEEEDSVALQTKQVQAAGGKINVAVILLRHLSNFTDFNVLERDRRVHLFYTNNTEEIMKADIILIPGSKSTLSDLYELRRNGVAQAIVRAHREGATVMGICGGYQLMGQDVCDPDHVEGSIERLPGLGLLPVSTRMQGEKVTRQVKFRFHQSETLCEGYEIHMGTTTPIEQEKASPLNYIENEARADGYFKDRTCMGTYIHGILDNASFINYLLEPFAHKAEATAFDYKAFKEEQYDKLADHVRKHVNLPLIYKILTAHD